MSLDEWTEADKCTVPSTLTEHTGLAEEHGEEVAEGAERDEEVEAPDGTARAEDVFEEQACGYLCRMLEIRLRDCWSHVGGLYSSKYESGRRNLPAAK